jgi:hypothetical protein
MTFDDMDEAARHFLKHLLKQFAGNKNLACVRALIAD